MFEELEHLVLSSCLALGWQVLANQTFLDGSEQKTRFVAYKQRYQLRKTSLGVFEDQNSSPKVSSREKLKSQPKFIIVHVDNHFALLYFCNEDEKFGSHFDASILSREQFPDVVNLNRVERILTSRGVDVHMHDVDQANCGGSNPVRDNEVNNKRIEEEFNMKREQDKVYRNCLARLAAVGGLDFDGMLWCQKLKINR